MALETHPDEYGLPPASLAAARQHVQTLSARDREALLRALLEQYEHPQDALLISRSDQQVGLAPQTPPPEVKDDATSSPKNTGAESSAMKSISAFASSLFTGPLSPRSDRPDPASIPAPLAVSPSPPISSDSRTAPSPTPVSRFRAHSLTQPLLSSFSPHPSKRTTSHSLLRSHSSSEAPKTSITTPSTTKTATRGTTTAPSSATTSAGAAHEAITPLLSPPSSTRAFWCTSCGEKFFSRTEWEWHDVTCRGPNRSSSQDPTHPQHVQHAWACGFCAAFLGSQERYHDHVAAHFTRGKTLAHWHYVNVIYGLLHQPVVHEAWKRLWATRTASLPPTLRPKATWPPDCTTKADDSSHPSLQEALELFDPALHSAEALAMQADALAIYVTVPVEHDASLAPSRAGSRSSATPSLRRSQSSTTQPLLLATRRESKRDSNSSRKPKPLTLFRSKHASATAVGVPVATDAEKRQSVPLLKSSSNRPAAQLSISTSISSLPRRNDWADRPLPPLQDAKLEDGASSSSSSQVPCTALSPRPVDAQATRLTLSRPPSPPPKTKTQNAVALDRCTDWNSVATTIVEEIMTPLDTTRITI